MKVITLNGVIGWDVTADQVQKDLKEANGEDIRIEINSPGGFVDPGLYIYNLIKNYSGQVHTHVMGYAMSMASIIALAGNYVTAESNSIFMIHNASLFAAGDYRTLRKAADISEGISNMLAKVYASKSQREAGEIRQLMDEESYFYGGEGKEAGFFDDIMSTETPVEKQEALAVAQTSFIACKQILRDSEKSQEDIERVAAMLSTKLLGEDKAIEAMAKNNQGGKIMTGAQKPTESQAANPVPETTTLVSAFDELQGKVGLLEKTIETMQKDLNTAQIEVQKAQDEKRMLEIQQEIAPIGVIGDLSKVAKNLFLIEKIDPQLYKDEIQRLKDTSEALNATGIFSEVGSSAEGKVLPSAYDELKVKVDELVADGTPAVAAWREAIKKNPELYKRYREIK
jgi:ATP-dependent protease ClpP protease subunit